MSSGEFEIPYLKNLSDLNPIKIVTSGEFKLPFLKMFANLRPIRYSEVIKVSEDGWHCIKSDFCPDKKLWFIIFTSAGVLGPYAIDINLYITDENNSYKDFLASMDDFSSYKNLIINSPYWVGAGERLVVEFSRRGMATEFYICFRGFELDYSG